MPAGNDADIIWAVEIDASTGLKALETSLDAAQEQLNEIDTEARRTGASLSRLLTITFDGSALDRLRMSLDALAAAIPSTTAAAATFPMAEMMARLKAPVVAEPEPDRPALIQSGLASAPIREAREELLATQKTAEGVGAALRLARENLDGMKVAPEFAESIRAIGKDFLAGRATADEAIAAINATQRGAVAEIMETKRQEKAQFLQAEREKQQAIETTARLQTQHSAAIAITGQAAMALTTATGSSVAMMLSLQEQTRRTYGETQIQLFGLHQLQEAVPHTVAALTGLTAMATGGIAGIITGIPALITGIVGMIVAANKPPPRPEARTERTEDAFARVLTAGLKGDVAQVSRERMVRSLESIDRHLTGASAGAPLRESPVGR